MSAGVVGTTMIGVIAIGTAVGGRVSVMAGIALSTNIGVRLGISEG